VIQVGVLYGAVGWIILEGASALPVTDAWPSWTVPFALGLVIIGFPVALLFAWSWEDRFVEGAAPSTESGLEDEPEPGSG